MPPSPHRIASRVKQDGRVGETQRFRRRTCRRTVITRRGTPFAGHRWPQGLIVTSAGTLISSSVRAVAHR